MNVQEQVEKYKGNWKRFDSFAWTGRPDDADDWCIIHTSCRDSGIKELSNAAYFYKRLNPLVDDTEDVLEFGAGHWTVGHVDGWAVRVVDKAGRPTRAFEIMLELVQESKDRDILDPDDHALRFEAGKRVNIEFYARHCMPKGVELKRGLPDDWIDRVMAELDAIDPCWTDDLDQDGTPRPRDLERALDNLGLLERDAA